jgi:hypothetical protein
MSLTREELIAAASGKKCCEHVCYCKRPGECKRPVRGCLASDWHGVEPPARGSVPALADFTEVGHALTGLKICDFCHDNHFRAYPNQPGYSCNKIPCQCWCGDRDDKPLEVD